ASLGFSEAPGFAAGIARPFRPYLLGEERPADLTLMPLAVMDTTLHSHLSLSAEEGAERALRVLDVVRRHGGRSALLWHNTSLADDRAPGYGEALRAVLAELGARGAELGPIAPPAPPSGDSLDGVRAVHLTTVHRPRDVRIFHKEARALRRAGATALVAAPEERIARTRRLQAGWRLARLARAHPADLYHLHDPELLPVGLWLRRATGARVVYDVHEYLGSTSRTKRWIPQPLRQPVAALAERAEQRLAARLDGVVAVNPDLAARFAVEGAHDVGVVTNAPWGVDFPPPAPPADEPIALYVGGLGPLRGLPLMKRAFPLLTTHGARLVLAGPGEPGDLPERASALGLVDHSEVAGLLAAARCAWIPLQRHGNYDRAVPTKLIEAMAAGRPVVASDLGTMGAIVRAAGCGILVPPDDADAHAQALDALLGDPELSESMGTAGRRHLEQGGLTFERQAEHLTDLYARVLR
ncbi:MAG: glycosyltransferase, partial [Miltoncostaeaceae bacterium]